MKLEQLYSVFAGGKLMGVNWIFPRLRMLLVNIFSAVLILLNSQHTLMTRQDLISISCLMDQHNIYYLLKT